jgi:hypothetical protein
VGNIWVLFISRQQRREEHMRIFHTNRLSIVLVVLALAAQARANIPLLTIDATNPADTIITATSGDSAASNNNTAYSLLLMNTGIPSSGSGNDISGNFGPAAGGTYNFASTGSVSGSLEINGGGGLDQIFTAGDRAFVGQSTVDLSFLTFPTTGVTGNIDIRDDFGNDTGIVVGQYELIVPEPTSLSLLAFGGLALLRRRSRRIVRA